MVTIKDVAKRANVSPATVSLVLNKRSISIPISAATKERVRAAAKELDYQPNTYAKTLRTNKSPLIGILAFDIIDPYCSNVIRGASEIINGNDYLALLSDLQNDNEKLITYITQLQKHRIAGLLILASSLQIDDHIASELNRLQCPCVIIGREIANPFVSTVVTDNIHGSFLAIEHLIQLGHTKIAFIIGPHRYIDSHQRFMGSKRALEQYKIALDEEMIEKEQEVGWGPESGYNSMQRLLKKGKKFTALFAFDDISAFGAIRAISEAKLNVPQDISVIGFDDLSVSAFYHPPLTTIQYSMANMGKKGAELLLESIQKDGKQTQSKKIVEKTRLVVRATTAPPNDTS